MTLTNLTTRLAGAICDEVARVLETDIYADEAYVVHDTADGYFDILCHEDGTVECTVRHNDSRPHDCYELECFLDDALRGCADWDAARCEIRDAYMDRTYRYAL